MSDSEERDVVGEVIAEDAEGRNIRVISAKDADGETFVRAADYDALRQQLADVSNERDGLRDQVLRLSSEGRTITLSGCEIKEADLIWGVMRNLHGNRRNTLPRWALVRDAFGTGSGVATALCRRFNLNPEEVLKS